MADRATTFYEPGRVTTSVAAPPVNSMGGNLGFMGDAVQQLLALRVKQQQDDAAYQAEMRKREALEYAASKEEKRKLAGMAALPKISGGGGGTRGFGGDPGGGGGRLAGPDPLQQAVQRSNAERQIAENEALMRGAPMKHLPAYMAGLGGGPAMTMDVNNMTGIQRQLFLPQGATAAQGGLFSGTETGSGGSDAGDDDFSRFARQSAARRAIAGQPIR